MKKQHNLFCYWGMIWLLFFLMAGVPSFAMAQCVYEPDAVDCPCFVDGGVWDPSGGYIQDIADATFGTMESCSCPGTFGCTWDPVDPNPDPSNPIDFVDGGKPYYQMVLGCDEPFVAFSMAVLINSGVEFPGRGAWCTETVAYWHKHAHIPYPGGYRTDWHEDWQVYSARDLMSWYARERLLNGRGRWIYFHEVNYDDIELGVSVPVPGAYVAIRGYEYGYPDKWLEWRDTGHSLIIDEMWIHADHFGKVCQIEVYLQEGNSENRVRTDRHWDDILSLTPQGSGWIGDRKIFGFGIDLDGEGNPIYDPSRLHGVLRSTLCPPAAFVDITPPLDPQWDEQQFQKVFTYASLLRSQGGPKVECSSGSLKISDIPDGANKQWHFPSGLAGSVEILIDLLYEHPFPIKGIELRWDGAYLPVGYKVHYAGSDQAYKEAQVADLSNIVYPNIFQGQPKEFPVPCRFDNGGTGASVRYVKLVFPEGTFANEAILRELRFWYNTGSPEDASEHPEGTHLAPDCKNAYAEPMYLWPPNHKFQKIQIKGVVDPEGTPVKIKITSITQDEPVNGLGDGDTAPDGIIGNGTTAWVRAERSGKGNGRVYEIKFIATDAEGGSSRGSVKVMVPHSQKKLAMDDGQHYDSTQQP